MFKKSNGGGVVLSQKNSSENYLLGNRRSYAPPSIGGEGNDVDVENGEGSLTTPLTEMERRMRDSEHLLRETQA